MAKKGRTFKNGLFTLIESDVFLVGTSITEAKVDAVKTHGYAGVAFFADEDGEVPATPAAGTVTITIKTVNTEPVFEPPEANNVIQAAAPQTVALEGNVQAVLATPLGVDVATHYRLRVTQNES